MGQMYIMNARGRIIDKIHKKVEKAPTIEKKFDVLREAVYELVEAITEETELERLEGTFP